MRGTRACEDTGACDSNTGECVYAQESNGTPCDDGDRCTAGDACLDGLCRSTRTPDDSLGDWVTTFSGTRSAQLAGLRVLSSGVVALVNLQVDEAGNRSLGLGGPVEVTIPEESVEAIAVFFVRLDGRPTSALLVSHGSGFVRGERLDALSDETLLVSGTGTGLVNRGADNALDLGDGPATRMFALKVASGQVAPEFWVATPSSQEGSGGVRAFVAAGADCVASVPVSNGVEVTLANARGEVASMVGDEGVFAGTWLVWLPGCGAVVGVQRYLRPASQGGLLMTAIDGGGDGDIAFAGFTTAGVSLEPPGGAGDSVLAPEGNRAFALRLDVERSVTFLEAVRDSANNGVLLPRDIAVQGRRTAYSLDVAGQAFLERPSSDVVAVPGNPLNEIDTRPRAVVLSREDGAAAEWLETFSFVDYDAKSGSAVGAIGLSGSERVLAMPSDEGKESLDGAADGIFEIRAISPTGEILWEAPLYQQPSSLSTVGRSFVRAVPNSESVVAGGTVAGVGRVIVSATLGLDVDAASSESASAVWILRLNSDDGVGCR